MILILLSIISCACIAGYLIHFGVNGYKSTHFVAAFFGFFLMAASIIWIVTYPILAWSWIASEQKANILNREFGTNYTREEIFWASGFIETIGEIGRDPASLNCYLVTGNRSSKRD